MSDINVRISGNEGYKIILMGFIAFFYVRGMKLLRILEITNKKAIMVKSVFERNIYGKKSILW